MSHYLITGTAGFIASRVAEMLLEQGHRVTGVDNLNDAYDVRLKEYRLKRLQAHPSFSFLHRDIGDRQQVEEIFQHRPPEGWQAVINLAARAGVRQSLIDPWVYFQTNLTGTLNLLEACRNTGIQKFILASTSSVYGADAPLPTPETASSDFPLQAYAASKKAAEVLCHSYHKLYHIDVSVLRYFTVYGPAGRPDMVMFRFVQWLMKEEPVQIYGGGEQSRGFTYVEDIARGTIAALKPLGYEIINLGGHQTVKINQLLAMLEDLTGKTARVEYKPAHPADMFANWADVEKAKRVLDWTPQVSLEEGIRRLVDWHMQEQSWLRAVSTG